MTEHPARIGFIGLGRMGRGMAGNLAKTGKLTVYDPVAEAVQGLVAQGARPAASITELASEADLVFTSLPGPAEVEAVARGEGGLLPALRPGAAWFDLSTSSRTLAVELEAAFSAKSAAMLDAPVSGGPAGAATGDLVLWVGGDRATFDRHLPVLQSFARTPLHVGPIGAGTVTKLAHNMLGYTIMEAMAESFSLAVKAGLDPVDFWEALRFGVVGKQSPLFMLTQQFLPAVYDKPAFALRLALKDVRLATAMAEDLAVPMRLSAATRADMESAVANGKGDEDSRAFLKLQLERAGVTIAAEPARIAAAVAAAKA